MNTNRTVKGFERYVNSKDNQTFKRTVKRVREFERYVNSKDNQTDWKAQYEIQ